jgi:sugar lactone lactonase YvrE
VKLDVVVDGCGYLESPRWHDGALWLSDFDARHVLRVRDSEDPQVVAEIPNVPSGLAFTDTSLLVASMRDQAILTVGCAGSVGLWADLSSVAVGFVNDMARDGRGNVYVGCFGYDLTAREKPRPGPLLHVDAHARARVACPDLMFANGMVVTDGGASLIVAESAASLITRFRIGPEGELRDREIFTDLGSRRQPDGICVDAESGIWVASPFTEEFIRLASDGSVTHVVPTPGRWAVACTLGGPGGSTFFAVTAETDLKRFARGESRGRVEAAIAPIPAATC